MNVTCPELKQLNGTCSAFSCKWMIYEYAELQWAIICSVVCNRKPYKTMSYNPQQQCFLWSAFNNDTSARKHTPRILCKSFMRGANCFVHFYWQLAVKYSIHTVFSQIMLHRNNFLVYKIYHVYPTSLWTSLMIYTRTIYSTLQYHITHFIICYTMYKLVVLYDSWQGSILVILYAIF